MDALRVGLLGLGRGGQQLASALTTSAWCRLVAAASARPERVQRFAQTNPGVAAYSDFRSLIVENRLAALFVALPPYLRVPYLNLAAERHIPVFVLGPPARRLDEAVELAQRFAEAECPIVVSRAWDCEPALQTDASGVSQIGRVFLARGTVMTCWSAELDWRGDSLRAGGGVLLHAGYGLVDSMVQAMGMPGSVYAQMAGISRPDRRVPYDTEDTAALTCTFAGGGMGSLSACWTSGPEEWLLALHGTSGSLEVDTNAVVHRDRPGSGVLGGQERAANPLLAQVEEFLSIVQANPRKLRSTLRSHLPTMAVMEAAYLSAKTGQPESPEHIARMHAL